MRADVKLILQEVREIKKSCRNMDQHIGFVDNVYSTVRCSAEYVLQRVARFRGSEPPQLPPPEEKCIEYCTCRGANKGPK